MNKTISERIKYMFSYVRLFKSFLGEAMKTTIFIINLSPLVPFNFDVLDRVWKGKNIS
jgi:hypothetical protein